MLVFQQDAYQHLKMVFWLERKLVVLGGSWFGLCKEIRTGLYRSLSGFLLLAFLLIPGVWEPFFGGWGQAEAAFEHSWWRWVCELGQQLRPVPAKTPHCMERLGITPAPCFVFCWYLATYLMGFVFSERKSSICGFHLTVLWGWEQNILTPLCSLYGVTVARLI